MVRRENDTVLDCAVLSLYTRSLVTGVMGTVLTRVALTLTSTHYYVLVRNTFKGQPCARPAQYPRTLR